MATKNAQRDAAFSVRLEKAHQRIWGAFVQALKEKGASHTQAARSMRVTVNTVANYVHGRTDVNVKRVIASKLLGGPFLNRLCVHDHPAPYVARKSSKRAA
jgi:hypothetical protein